MTDTITAEATTIIPTAHASRYLQQLCKHWSHKFETEFDAQKGRINFGAAAVHLEAGEAALTMTLHAADTTALDRMENVVAEHLKRFAFREELAIDWVRA